MSNPFHKGELTVQARAGVAEQAKQVGRIIHPHLPNGAEGFLANLPILFQGGIDSHGHVWASALTGTPGSPGFPGFITAKDPRTVHIHPNPRPDDPNTAPPPNAPVGFLAINLATRQRFRFNGRATQHDDTLAIHIDQAYGNCPKYIQRRAVTVHDSPSDIPPAVTRASLGEADLDLIRRADTFFIATTAGDHGVDVSHRGGAPGFVRIGPDGTLSFNDYPGNNMFQTLGNLAADPRAGLLFIDFETGTTLQLTGHAQTGWSTPSPEELADTGRTTTFTALKMIHSPQAIPLRWVLKDYSPYNPEEKTQ